MTVHSVKLGKAPFFGMVAILVSGLTLMVAAGPAIAAERGSATVGASSTLPPADPQDVHAS